MGFFQSMKEDKPWLRIQLNRPTSVFSVSIINRRDCCGERLRNLQLRGGNKSDLTNEVLGLFKGPGATGGVHVIRLKRPAIVEYLSFQLMMDAAVLQINGVRLNKEPPLPQGL